MDDNSGRNMTEKSGDRIERLWGHLSDLPPAELAEHIRRVRADRRKRKEKVTDRKARVVKSDSARQKAEALLAGLTPEQIAKFMKDM